MKMTFRLLIVILIATVLFSPACKPTDYSAEINALKARSDSLAAALKVTNANLQATNNTLASLSTTITSIQAQLTVISGQISTLNTQLTATNAIVSDHTATIATIQSAIKIIQDQIAALNTQQIATSSTVISISTTIISIQTQITSILVQVATLNTQQTTTNASLSDIYAQLTLSNNQLISLSLQFNALLTQLSMVVDIEGNYYHTVTIGTQVWLVENLKTTKYNDGTSIPNVTDDAAWDALTNGAYCLYNNDAANKNTYGALYNWYTVNTGKLAPTGWHIPTDDEWTILTTYLGGESVAGGKLKETGTIHWTDPNYGATNESGFTAVPAGSRGYGGSFYNISHNGLWWCSTESTTDGAWLRVVSYGNNMVGRYGNLKMGGFSVRCVKNTSSAVIPTLNTTIASSITATTVSSGGNISSDGGATVTARGVCWSTNQNPTIADSKTADGTGSGIFTSFITGLTANTTYYVRAYATNSAGTAYGNEETFTTATNGVPDSVTDSDGNVYQTVTIGTQVWMAENLKTTKYNDGTSIPNITDDATWAALSTGAYCWYNNDANYKDTFGALYNWYTVNTGKLAPIGWHVPSDAEWATLTNFLGGKYGAGAKLKEAGTTHWLSPNNGATNESGFTALPGGTREINRPYFGIYQNGYWWASTVGEYRYLGFDHTGIDSSYDKDMINYGLDKKHGFSVRCVKD